MIDLNRFDRQIRLFGRDGQEKLEALHIAVIGVGGTGSHVVQQLAYLGIRSYLLIDSDWVTYSSMNRLVGAVPADVADRVLKVEVADRLIRRVSPEVQVVRLSSSFIAREAFDKLRRVDVVFGCLDDDAARLILNEFCQAYAKPYFDLASDIPTVDDNWSCGGRIVFSTGGDGCLVCRGVLDQDTLDMAFSTDEQIEQRAEIYGVPAEALEEAGPAVVSLNGIVASAAVTEFMFEFAGLRPASRHLEYRGRMGGLFLDQDPPSPECHYCSGLYDKGDAADVMRWVRDGWGNHLRRRRQ
jgi:hypothetical protein